MIQIVIGTNRPSNISGKVARIYGQILENEGAEYSIVDLESLPRDIAFAETYGNRTEAYEQSFVRPVKDADKFVFVIPEYNGGFPGILKLFIDSIPPKYFHYKKAGLIGISNGRGGASRAMDQFSNVLNYLRVNVIAQKPKLSAIDKAFSEKGDIHIEEYMERLEDHARRMIAF